MTDSGAFVEDTEDLTQLEELFVSQAPLAPDATGGSGDWCVQLPAESFRGWYRHLLEQPRTWRFLYVVAPAGHLQQDPPSTDQVAGIEHARHLNRFVGAVADLRSWLGLSAHEVCELVSLTPSTFYNWVAHPDAQARPSTVWKLLAVWSIAGLAQAELGEKRARIWWGEGEPTRLDRARGGDREELSRLSTEIADLLGAAEPLEVVPTAAPTAEEAMAAFHELMVDDPAS